MKIAFNTANLVGRPTGYRFSLSNWGEQHRIAAEQTDDAEWGRICAEIAANGYTAVEVWAAHADSSVIDAKGASKRLRIMHDHGISAVGYSGGIFAENAEIIAALGISKVNGMFPKSRIEEIEKLCNDYDVYCNYENHHEKSVDEIRSTVDGGSARIGVAIDSGWLGTQAMDSVQAIEELGPLVRHLHVKDVVAAGGHETCLLGHGVAGVGRMIAALKRTGYSGWYSWEDEPEDRNPMESAAQNLRWILNELLKP